MQFLFDDHECLMVPMCINDTQHQYFMELICEKIYCLFHLLQYEKVLKFISTARSEGATILSGGVRPKVECLSCQYQHCCFLNLLLKFCYLINNGSIWRGGSSSSQPL